MEEGFTPPVAGESLSDAALSKSSDAGLPAGDSIPTEAPESSGEKAPEDSFASLSEKYRTILAQQRPEVVEAEHKALAKVEPYGRLYQRSLDAGVKSGVLTRTTQIEEDLRATQEERQRMDRTDAWDRGLTPEQRDQLRNNDAFARQASNGRWGAADYDRVFTDLRQFREQTEQAPIRQRIYDQALFHYGKAAQDNLLAVLQSDPELASVADWSKALVGSDATAAPEEQTAQVLTDVFKIMYRHAERKVRAELGPKYEADALAKIADGLGPDSEPLVVAGAAIGNGSDRNRRILDTARPGSTEWDNAYFDEYKIRPT